MSVLFCCLKQKPAYEWRISDWSSDVCSSDLIAAQPRGQVGVQVGAARLRDARDRDVFDADVRRRGHHARHGLRMHGRIQQRDRAAVRSDERRVGQECVSTCRYRGTPLLSKKNQTKKITSVSTHKIKTK